MGFQCLYRIWRATALQISGTGIQMTGIAPERKTDQVAGLRKGTADREVQLALGRVDGFVGEDHVDIHLGIALAVLRDQPRHHPVTEKLRG